MIKISVLAENTACRPEFASEHGLSLYIETDRRKILFDSGQSEIFAENASLLGIDLSKVDIAILSHGHYDHSGGLEHFLEINSHAPVYLSRYAFGNFHNSAEKYIGLSPELKESNRLIFTEDYLKIDGELELYSCNNCDKSYPTDSAGLTEKASDGFIKDIFLHEQYLTIHDDGRKIAVSGCSHKGVLNIVEWLKPDIFVGGFHFMKQEVNGGNFVLNNAAKILSDYQTEYYTCHCTGTEQYKYLKEKMGEKLNYISAGQKIIL